LFRWLLESESSFELESMLMSLSWLLLLLLLLLLFESSLLDALSAWLSDAERDDVDASCDGRGDGCCASCDDGLDDDASSCSFPDGVDGGV